MAFYQSPDAFMAENWVEIALVDYAFKLIISLLLFLPAYAVLLKFLAGRLTETNDELYSDRAKT